MFLDIFNPVFSKNPFLAGFSSTPLSPPDETDALLGKSGVSGWNRLLPIERYRQGVQRTRRGEAPRRRFSAQTEVACAPSDVVTTVIDSHQCPIDPCRKRRFGSIGD